MPVGDSVVGVRVRVNVITVAVEVLMAARRIVPVTRDGPVVVGVREFARRPGVDVT